MPPKPRDVKRAQGYLPADLFEQLERRAERNYNSISREVVQILAEALQKDAQEQSKVVAQ